MSLRAARALCVLVAAGSWLLLAPATGAAKTTSAGAASAAPSRDHASHRHGARSRRGLRARPDRAHAAIVGGAPISVAQAPWQVTVEAMFPTSKGSFESILCGGSIIDSSHILTAAHCVFIAPPNERIPPGDFVVRAGTSNLKSHEPGELQDAVTNVRVHPFYTYTPNSGHVNSDDVAVLELEKPLVLGPDMSPIPLSTLGVYPVEGMALNLSGFGEQNPSTKELNGELYSLGMNLGSSEACGGESNAVILCASSPSGSPCSGDSGSGLTTAGSPALLGVENDYLLVSGQACAAGARNSFANVAAPEIQDFIDGSEEPPRAPRGAGASCLAASTVVGSSMTCLPGAWSGSPTFTYTFIDSSNGQVLQSGSSPEYQFSAAAVGSAVFMRLQATNAGGTGIDRTTPTAAIVPAAPAEPEPPAPSGRVTLAGASIAVQGGGMALVKLDCLGPSSCHGKLALTAKVTVAAKGRRRRSRTIAIGIAKFSIAAGKTATVKLELNATGRALLAADHGRLSALLTILELEPGPAQMQSKSVRLVQRKAHGKKK